MAVKINAEDIKLTLDKTEVKWTRPGLVSS